MPHGMRLRFPEECAVRIDVAVGGHLGHVNVDLGGCRERGVGEPIMQTPACPPPRWPWSRARHLIADQQGFAETIIRISGQSTAP